MNPLADATSLGELIAGLYVYAQTIIGLGVFCMFLMAGLIYIIPALRKYGDPVTIMQDAVIGTVLLFSAYLILNSINPALVGREGGGRVTGSGSVILQGSGSGLGQ